MSSEEPFRWAIIAMLVTFMPIGIYHRLQAAKGGRVSRRAEGTFPMIGLRACAFLAWLGMLAYLIDPPAMSWASLGWPRGLRWVGLPLSLLAMAWVVWMFRTLGPNLTDTVTVRPGAYLVTWGPYRWVRHPLYVGALGIFVAWTLLTANAYIAVMCGATVALLLVRTRIEEAKLIEQFDGAYLDYARRTGRFWPRLGRQTALPGR